MILSEDITIQNPILRGDYPDPSILRVGDNFYLTHSSFNWAPGLLIWQSPDLANWTPVCFALPDYDGDVWAPDLVAHGGRFYIYYKTSSGNHVVTATRIQGPWSAPYDVECGHIDPGHVVGPDGTRYLHLSGGNAVALTPDGLKTVGEPETVYGGWEMPANWRVEGVCLEGPKLFRRGGYYYLVSAVGGTAGPATSHSVIVARSAGPLGPWENAPNNPLVHTESRDERWWSCGHGTLFEDRSGQWWCIYHAYDSKAYALGRQTLLEPIQWRPDGWPERVPGFDRVAPLPLTPSAACTLVFPHDDEFESETLDMQWRFWGEHDQTRYRVGGGELWLQARGTSPSDTSPMSALTGDLAYELCVDVEVLDGCEAGVMLYYNPSCFAGLSLCAGALRLLRCGERAWYPVMDGLPDRVCLRLINDHHEVDLFVCAEGGDWMRLTTAIETSGYHHNVLGGFLSLRPAVFACGSGSAIFRHWRYKPLP